MNEIRCKKDKTVSLSYIIQSRFYLMGVRAI